MPRTLLAEDDGSVAREKHQSKAIHAFADGYPKRDHHPENVYELEPQEKCSAEPNLPIITEPLSLGDRFGRARRERDAVS
jgi:hypothetical protein